MLFPPPTLQVSLRPALSSLKLGSGSSRHANQPNEKGPPLVVEAREEVRSHVPRTRDDSSDDEDSVDVMRGQGTCTCTADHI